MRFYGLSLASLAWSWRPVLGFAVFIALVFQDGH